MENGFKRCYRCKQIKPISDFHKDTSKPDSRADRCRACYSEHYGKNRATYRKIYLKKIYGITSDDYDAMLSEQNYVCAICGKLEMVKDSGVTRNLAVDHCHKTGKIRGLLCQNCNKALGCFRDDIDVMASAISYLQQP